MIDFPATALPVISSRSNFPNVTYDESKVAAVNLLLMFANAYYKMLECAARSPCKELDMKFNQRYLWVVKNIRHLLLRHQDLADFPVRFHPIFPDLNPTTIRDAEWEAMIAPEAEKFISAIQMYAVDYGIRDPDVGSAAWLFLQQFRPGIDEAINAGYDYHRRMVMQAKRKRRSKNGFVQRIQETQDAIRKNTDLIPSLVHKVDRTPQKTVAMFSGATRKRMRATGAVVEDDFKASQQYRNINWQGRSYRLNPNAARIVEALHDAHRTIGLPSLHQEEIFSRAFGSDRRKWPSRHPRVQNFFRTGDGGRLWRDGLCGHDQKGNFWLNLASVRRTEYVR